MVAEGSGKAGSFRRFRRRTLLRGAGVALALPWLEALAPRQAHGQAAPVPKRFLPIFFPCGAPSFWWPQAEGSGSGWQLSSVLEPLAPLKEHVTVLGNFENGTPFNANGSSSVEPSHGRLSGAFLTCVDADDVRRRLSNGSGTPVTDANGVSVDQVLAQARAGTTAIDSLQLGLATTQSSCDGKPCSQSRSISWATETKPLYKEIDPQKVFDTLFGSGDLSLAGKSRRDRSVLDAVLESSKALDGKLSVQDRQTLDQYLTSIRETEQRLTTTSTCAAMPVRPQLAVHSGLVNGQEGYDRNTHCDVMTQLIALAFQCDSTRVISFMLEDERSDFVYDHLLVRNFTATTSTPDSMGVRCGGLHGDGQSGSVMHWSTMAWWHTLKVSELCQKLASFPEGEGNVLDHTVVLYASSMHGSDHSAANLPLALIGGRSMLKTDRYFSLAPHLPLRDVYYTLLKGCFELDVEGFGEDKTGAPVQLLEELLV